MFLKLERTYLITLAEACKRQGLSRSEAFKAIHADIGDFTAGTRIQCAITCVWDGTEFPAANA